MRRKQNFAKVTEAKMQPSLEKGHGKPDLPYPERHAAQISKGDVFPEQTKTKERINF